MSRITVAPAGKHGLAEVIIISFLEPYVGLLVPKFIFRRAEIPIFGSGGPAALDLIPADRHFRNFRIPRFTL